MIAKQAMVGVILVLIVVTMANAPGASASGAGTQVKFTWGVVTGTIYLDKRETAYLSLGAGAASTFASALPPPVNFIVSGSAALLAAYAGKAVVDGRCLKIKISTFPFTTAVQPGTYGPKNPKSGRYCK